MTAFLDKHLKKFVSRKLLAWITVTVAMFMGLDIPDNWAYVTMVFIGGQALVDYKNA